MKNRAVFPALGIVNILCRYNKRLAARMKGHCGRAVVQPQIGCNCLFQLSRLFDMNESWETDTAIAALIAFHPQLDEEDFSRMEPIFQRAANIIINSWAVYENFLATFLLEYQRLWTQKDTANQGFLSKLFTRLEERLKGIDANRGAYERT